MNSYMEEPLEIALAAPEGNYEVTVDIKAHEDTSFCIFAQHRSFAVRDEYIKSGETRSFTFVVNVCGRNFYGDKYRDAEGIKIQVVCDGSVTATAAASPVEVPTVYICGDSTVTDQPAEYPYIPSETFCGWGQAFPMLTRNTVAVSNHAQSGSCTAEFMEANLKAFEDKIKPGDFMVIEFGHNDQKKPELSAEGGYSKNVGTLIDLAKAKGAVPIVCSPINRIIFEPDGHLKNLLGGYRNAAKETAERGGAAFIDMWSMTTDYMETAGPVKSWQFFRCKGEERDYTHTNDIGGTLIAKMFASAMTECDGPLSAHIDETRIGFERVISDPGDSADNSDIIAHSKSIGLVNVPDDLDADITGLQIGGKK